jgi:hypothetical protein
MGEMPGLVVPHAVVMSRAVNQHDAGKIAIEIASAGVDAASLLPDQDIHVAYALLSLPTA